MPSSLPLRYQHWRYVWIPLFGAFIWFGESSNQIYVPIASVTALSGRHSFINAYNMARHRSTKISFSRSREYSLYFRCRRKLSQATLCRRELYHGRLFSFIFDRRAMAQSPFETVCHQSIDTQVQYANSGYY